MLGQILGAAISGAANYGLSVYNNQAAAERAKQDRQENYMYGEMAANNADARTRALYNDFYSPEALMQQYKASGMSPAMLLGGTPGQGGTVGAQGHGASGIQTPYMPMSLVDTAQAASLFAQAEKTKAETKNVQQDTILKKLEQEMSSMTNQTLRAEFEIMNSTWTDKETGKETSLYEIAKNHYDFDSYLEEVRKGLNEDPTLKTFTTTENGIKTLRSIFTAANRFDRDISVLSEEKTSADFQRSVLEALNKLDYANINAQAAIAQLKQEISTNELTETQKEAWNNLINRLGKNGSTTKDIIVVLGMILGNFASHTGIKINVGGKK